MTPTAGTAVPRERTDQRGREVDHERVPDVRSDDFPPDDADTAAVEEHVIVLPEAPERQAARRPTPIETLTQEFAGLIAPDVVERATAAARHVLERARTPATPEAVERLARDQLRARLSPSVRRRR